MNKLGILTATFFLACSSSKPAPTAPRRSTAAPAAVAAEVAEPAPPAWTVDATPASATTTTSDVPAREGSATGGDDATETTAPTGPAAPRAAARLVATKDGAAVGLITFLQVGPRIDMAGTFAHLPPGAHAFYIHELGDCSRRGTRVGRHLDPTKAKHGPPSASTRHAGDLGDLLVDADGNASFAMSTDSVVMEDGRPDSILRRAIVIHARKDDRRGSGGAAIACGVIELATDDGTEPAAVEITTSTR